MSSSPRRLKLHREASIDRSSTARVKPQQSAENAALKVYKRKYKDCRLCNLDHPLRKCARFRRLSIQERIKVVRQRGYCFNCLAHSHRIKNCRSRERCGICLSEHHTLLHRDTNQRRPNKSYSCNYKHHNRRRQGFRNQANNNHRQISSTTVPATSNTSPTIVINVTAKS